MPSIEMNLNGLLERFNVNQNTMTLLLSLEVICKNLENISNSLSRIEGQIAGLDKT